MEKWHSKVALVTGASSGIGRHVSQRLLEHGVKVVGCGRDLTNLEKAKKEFPQEINGNFFPFKCDVGKCEEVAAMFNFIKNKFGELSICINNAGVLRPDAAILEGKTVEWQTICNTNLLGLCECVREAYALMKENEGKPFHDVPGHIINICSTLGHGIVGVPYFSFYSVIKHAVTCVTQCIRQELLLKKSRIKVSQISPGMSNTEFFVRGDAQELCNTIIQCGNIALESEDTVDAVVFALSTAPRSVVGDILIRPIQSIE